ncbi:MAG: HEAT repeat domain-containing protein, partial [Planctomycetaceae bacterium]|nr:HEAT repeat domain-containing protein [Planctomycetaceae bacterium]
PTVRHQIVRFAAERVHQLGNDDPARGPLLEMLASACDDTDVVVAQSAAQSLVGRWDLSTRPKIVVALTRALASDDADIRRESLQSLASLRNEHIDLGENKPGDVVASLLHQNKDVREEALKTLKAVFENNLSLPSDAESNLVARLESLNAKDRLPAIEIVLALSGKGIPLPAETNRALVAGLREYRSESDLISANDFGEQDGVRELVDLLRKEPADPAVVNLLLQCDSWGFVFHIEPAQIRRPEDPLSEPDSPDEELIFARQAGPILTGIMLSKAHRLGHRRRATRALGRILFHEAANDLIGVVRDTATPPELRIAAIESLAELKSDESIGLLFHTAVTAEHCEIQEASLSALELLISDGDLSKVAASDRKLAGDLSMSRVASQRQIGQSLLSLGERAEQPEKPRQDEEVPSLETVIEALGDPARRQQAIVWTSHVSFGSGRDSRAELLIDPLCKLLRDGALGPPSRTAVAELLSSWNFAHGDVDASPIVAALAEIAGDHNCAFPLRLAAAVSLRAHRQASVLVT